jgi:thymidine kinase
MRLFAGSVGVANSMQYLVLLPGLALVHRGELFTQSRAHVTCNDEARAGNRLVTQKAEQMVDVGSML